MQITGLVSLVGFLSVGVFLLGFGYWAATAPIGGATIAPGVVAAAGQNVMIQHLDGGIITSIRVREGDRVSKGQALITLDTTLAQAQLNRVLKQWVAQRAEVARLDAERDSAKEVDLPDELRPYSMDPNYRGFIVEQTKEFQARFARYMADQEILKQRVSALQEAIVGMRARKDAVEKQLAIVNEETERKKALLDKGLTNRSEYTDLLRSTADLVGQAAAMAAQIARFEAGGALENVVDRTRGY